MTDGDQVVVVGGGPVGVLIATVARQRGARVLLVEPDPFRRAVAAGIGIDAVDPAATDVAALVDARTEGAGADVAFEVSGSAAGVATAVDVLATRGRLVMVAIHPQPRAVNLHRFFWRELNCSAPGSTSATTWWRRSGWSPPARSRPRQLISRVVPARRGGVGLRRPGAAAA